MEKGQSVNDCCGTILLMGVTSADHAQGSYIFMQPWQFGRAAYSATLTLPGSPKNLGGPNPYVSSSDIPIPTIQVPLHQACSLTGKSLNTSNYSVTQCVMTNPAQGLKMSLHGWIW